jgi:hypothetical protein
LSVGKRGQPAPGPVQVITGLLHVITGLPHVITELPHVITELPHVITELVRVITGPGPGNLPPHVPAMVSTSGPAMTPRRMPRYTYG